MKDRFGTLRHPVLELGARFRDFRLERVERRVGRRARLNDPCRGTPRSGRAGLLGGPVCCLAEPVPDLTGQGAQHQIGGDAVDKQLVDFPASDVQSAGGLLE